MRTSRGIAWYGLLLLYMLASAASVAATMASVRAGQDDAGFWLEVSAGEELYLEPTLEGGMALEFRGWSVPAGTLGPLEGWPGVRVLTTPEGGGVEVPFSPSELRSVERVADGWRFVFAAPVAAAGVPENTEYRLGIRDVIEIAVHGHEDLARTDAVPADGVLSFPLIGEIRVAGRTVAEVEEEIQRKLELDFLVDPKVTVRVKEYESQWVNVLGFVKTPGKYAIKGPTTLMDIITQAGGITDQAGPTVVVTRSRTDGTAENHEVARDDLFAADSQESGVVLHHGDVVNVPEQPTFYIQGEVKTPGSYPLERGYTLLKAISVAGGMSQWADRKEVELHREVDGEPTKIVLNLKAIEQRRDRDMELLPEDIIIVKRRLL